MTSLLLLAGAIFGEICGTLSLRMAATASKKWYLSVALFYLLAFTMLILTLDSGMALGVAYGIWAATGVALTAILSKFLFKESLTPIMSLGIIIVVAGVLLIEIGASH